MLHIQHANYLKVYLFLRLLQKIMTAKNIVASKRITGMIKRTLTSKRWELIELMQKQVKVFRAQI